MGTKLVKGQLKCKYNENGLKKKKHVWKDQSAANEENNGTASKETRRIRSAFYEGYDQSGSLAHHVSSKRNTVNHTGPVSDYKSMAD